MAQLREYYRIGLTYSSNAIEGNTLTESETKVVLEDGLTIGGKPLRDHLEAVGHSEALNMVYGLSQGNIIDEQSILDIHRLFYHRIDSENAGRYRTKAVIITGTTYTPPATIQSCRYHAGICFADTGAKKGPAPRRVCRMAAYQTGKYPSFY